MNNEDCASEARGKKSLSGRATKKITFFAAFLISFVLKKKTLGTLPINKYFDELLGYVIRKRLLFLMCFVD